MWEFLFEYGLFFAKTLTIVIAVVMIIVIAFSASQRSNNDQQSGELRIVSLSKRFEQYQQALAQTLFDKKALKQWQKEQKKAAVETEENARRRVFVLEFHGDIRASAVDSLRQEITALLTIAEAARGDEVVLQLESSGGLVHSYGLAASQLKRLKDKNIKLTITVDKVAASGGYLMACLADQLIAAPFAIIGSIGVLAQLPNFNRLLKKHNVDFEQLSAGEYKRTLSVFGENTEKARAKMRTELEDTHQLFKQFVLEQRPQLAIEKVATGEYWYGSRALDLQLVDALSTSDDYLLALAAEADIYQLTYVHKRSLREKLGFMVQVVQEGITRLIGRLA